ncbi:MAG: hypothetical protein ACI4XL_06140 [Bacillus sp. (in: firmicutes)]
MEFEICAIDCAFPVEITIDEDNGRYMIRKSDRSGEVFNTAKELATWIREHFSPEQFCSEEEYFQMLTETLIYLR